MEIKSPTAVMTEDTNPQVASPGNKVRHKSPSKLLRDCLRARMYWGRVRRATPREDCGVRQVEKQTEGLGNSESVAGGKIWTKITNLFDKKRKDIKQVPEVKINKREERESGVVETKPLPLEQSTEVRGGTSVRVEIGPGQTYALTENGMRMSRLEESKQLITALRHLVRTLHEGGKQIAFPTPEAVDRIQLKCSNIPTCPEELLSLVLRVFARRQEPFDLDGIYKDFVKSHGRLVFDSRQQWPQCYAVVRYA